MVTVSDSTVRELSALGAAGGGVAGVDLATGGAAGGVTGALGATGAGIDARASSAADA